ncbi:sulfite exporter TauE/SafE family protein [Aquirufa antheringensis]|uniref:Probable membrane transporter protein n=2 Tax=Aquirufa antheringensis TaxID=2516559 RepID=A0A4Q9BAI0_9BACT|nr:sulfite exporter TauE/SafE family protein [Aquirufa antheringensis]MCZ2485372.1 sulfite exporter TauE/SafE family protein [Aquirufa antheringensis]TBH72237.1 sulfite exporter TauE/SafE family protein [Aquirufa antheringensis]
MAFLYASVGHGGASGYLAVMALFAIAPPLMKQTALLLNLGVSLMSFLAFYRQGYFRWTLFWPFALGSIPAAFLGARIPLTDSTYKQILGACLFLAVIRMVISLKEATQRSLPAVLGIFTGAAIGLLSGMIGIGGGIILSPLLLLFRWASLKEAAAVSALFIFVNSVSGLAGLKTWIPLDQSQLLYWLFASLVGGFLGARWGAGIASNAKVKWILALVLVIASLKLWFI